MITGPRCGQPVEYYRLTRARDALDVVVREPDMTCWRPKGHAEREEAAGKPVRHASESSVRRSLARYKARHQGGRVRRRRKPPTSQKMSDPDGRVAA